MRSFEEIDTERSAVLAEKAELDEKLGSCNQQIAEAKAAAFYGEYSDPDWFRRVNFARTSTVRAVKAKARRLTELKAETRTVGKATHPPRTSALGTTPKELRKALWTVAGLARKVRAPEADEEVGRRLDAALIMLELLHPGWSEAPS